MLKSISKRIRNHFGDRIALCRIGGDEFLGLINSPSEKPLELYIAELRKLFATPFIVKGEHYMSGLSIGHATYPADGTRLDTLIHTAGLRMYQEKRICRIKRCPIRKSLSVEDVLKGTEESS